MKNKIVGFTISVSFLVDETKQNELGNNELLIELENEISEKLESLGNRVICGKGGFIRIGDNNKLIFDNDKKIY